MSIIACHISEYDFIKFNSSEHIGNFGTILNGSYFLSSTKGLHNFGTDGFLYKVQITPQNLFEFNLKTKEHWYLAREFQELFIESLAGISNYLEKFFEEQNLEPTNIDCISLSSLDYLDNKLIKEYIVLNDDIITIINKRKLNN